MKSVTVRGVTIGEGIPKICVPIVAETKKEILEKANEIRERSIDVVEWRADWFTEAFGEMQQTARTDEEALARVLTTAAELRQVLGELPLLFTFRTAAEGGERAIEQEAYRMLNRRVAAGGNVDLVDLELLTLEEQMADTVREIQDTGVKVIASSHDFQKTPSKQEIVSRLCRMQEAGCDIAKMAVMPQNSRDVLTLLEATAAMREEHSSTPVITMSMSGTGVASRLIGECFGSALTFGAVGQASAPGQIGAEELRTVLEIIHRAV